MATKLSKFGFEVTVLNYKDGRCKISIDLPGNSIAFETEFYSEGEGLQFASDLLDDMKAMFKPYILMEFNSQEITEIHN